MASADDSAPSGAAPTSVATTTPTPITLHREGTSNIAEAAAAVADEANEAARDAPMATSPTIPPHTTAVDASSTADEARTLQGLGLATGVRSQDDLERDITQQARAALAEQEDERDAKRLARLQTTLERLRARHRTQDRRLATTMTTPALRKAGLDELAEIEADITVAEGDARDIRDRVEARHQFDGRPEEQEALDAAERGGADGARRRPDESQRDFLIRTGKITPFSKMPDRAAVGVQSDLTAALMDAEDEAGGNDGAEGDADAAPVVPESHQDLRLPGFAPVERAQTTTAETEFSLRPRKRRRLQTAAERAEQDTAKHEESEDSFNPSDADGNTSDEPDHDEDDEADGIMTARTNTSKKRKHGASEAERGKLDFTNLDDGDENIYQARLRQWVDSRRVARERLDHSEGTSESDDAVDEWFKPCPDAPDYGLDNGVRLPGDIHPALFDYQKTGVQWLGELYSQSVGGIVGDEMGLGKTIQAISFIAALHYSHKLTKPVIVVAPATVLRQWANEFHRWWPPLRVSILHSSGSGMLHTKNEYRDEDDFDEIIRAGSKKKNSKSDRFAKKVVDRVVEHGHVLITTYAGLQTYHDHLVAVHWEYAILDEGHKIRNPNTEITISCKSLLTPNRIILSGTPIQNNLIELWSLFDFVYPMRLGTLVNFRQTYEVPIKQGGYANATNLQILTAEKCAQVLKNAISPYLLQRNKADVASDLPQKSEQVLFCKLTRPQREAYEMFLGSEEMAAISARTRQPLYGIDILRKICNHPDLLDPRLRGKLGYRWGNPNKSGKMQVVKALLEMWRRFGHKTLLFSQGKQMLNILDKFVRDLDGFRYLRMDGETSVKDRQALVDRFNNEPDLHVFLLTTKVGGLGVNLTGANRVIIFDPDWNPSTDLQARERVWRLGQKKDVTIYRLMTAGTIEEKIYHRQIFKQFLTNKILKDPKQRHTFEMKDLFDLFTLGSADGTTETSEMFKGTEVQFQAPVPTAGPSPDDSTTPSRTVDTDAPSDLRNITGVAALEAFAPAEQEDEAAQKDSEVRLMSGIFARSGVHSALEHDQIINGKKVVRPDRYILDREAKRVAAEAAAELRKAGEIARTVQPGTVTWTGEVGETGRPRNVRRGAAGPSSAGILAGLSRSQGLSNGGGAAASTMISTTEPSSSSLAPSSTRGPASSSSFSASPSSSSGPPLLLRQIRDFLRAQGGDAPSQALVTHFGRACRTARQTAEFRSMLGEIATLRTDARSSRMRGRWVLKKEFR